MGEFMLSSEDVEEVRMEEKAEDGGGTVERTRRKERISLRMAELAKFLPKVALRVMLVESDDSTRQIVSALLRKCSYRVASVPDGLKAWEILKDKAHNIDLILTEVDLPSISGFALLTLIMEHDICKNIPVIMMSSKDSVSTVYKCMMKGAADYLVKPVRRNELRNLWRHVWRKETSIISGSLPQDASVGGQQRLEDEAASENDPASNHASGSMACVQGNDEQSSCTKPNLQAENAHMENMQEHQSLKREESLPVESEKHGAFAHYSEKPLRHESKSGGLVKGSCDNGYATNVSEGVETKRQRRDATDSSEARGTVAGSSRGAIDFMTTFNSQNFTPDNDKNKVVSHPGLDLTLRSHPDLLESYFNQERRTLWHPNASAFTRYATGMVHNTVQTSTGVSNQQKEFGINLEKSMSNVIVSYYSDTRSPTLTTPRSTSSLAIGQSKDTEAAESCPQKGFFPASVQVRSLQPNNLCSGSYSVFPSICCPRATVVSRVSTASNQQDHAFNVNPCNKSQQLYDRLFPNPSNSGNQAMQKQDNLSSFDDRGYTSGHTSATDQSGSSSLGNGARSHFIGYGNTCASNGNGNQVAVVNVSIESMKEDGSGNSHRYGQREAALNKFRTKRKDRCFEKKVRYESRKKLAEQRPRIKGQFVCQVQPDTQHRETQHQSDG